jgi:nucleoside-diphosphate-sugar epimerase
MRVFITGIRGFMGGELSQYLRARGAVVTGSAREPANQYEFRWKLGDEFPDRFFKNFDLVIHAAWDVTSKSIEPNLSATARVARQASNDGVLRQIFVSSHAARTDAATVYGRSKFLVEREFAALPGTISIRPGLVIGRGGLFWRLHELVRRWPMIPLLSGGRFQIPFLAIQDLGKVVEILFEHRTPRATPWALYHEEVPCQRDIVAAICSCHGWRRPVVTVPARPVTVLLRAIEAIGLPLSVRAANVTSALANVAAPELSDLSALVEAPTSLNDSIRATINSLKN